jgi:hypothetical protein
VPRPNRAAALLSVALATLVVVGCGGSSSLSRADLVSRANTICKRVNDKISAAGTATSAADVVRIGPGIVAAEQQGLNELRKLKPPSSLKADWNKILADLQVITNNAGKLVAAARKNDSASAQQAANDSTQRQTELDRLAGRDKLSQCAQG